MKTGSPRLWQRPGIQDVTRNGVTLHCTTTTAICLDGAGADTADWTVSYGDMQGHTARTVASRTVASREVAAAGTAETDSIYNGLGQLVSVADPDGIATLRRQSFPDPIGMDSRRTRFI